MTEKSLAIQGLTPRIRVITGNATAPPPSLVIPVKYIITCARAPRMLILNCFLDYNMKAF